jgi:exodeoxyribonuclease VII small subunit
LTQAAAAGSLDVVSRAPDSAVPEPSSFEDALERLETLVGELEQGDLDLEASLRHFEEGVRLTRRCSEELAAARQRVEVLVREGGGLAARPYEAADEAEPEDES